MQQGIRPTLSVLTALLGILVATLRAQEPVPQERAPGEAFRFRSGVELINVTATVSDQGGRFVGGLRKEDFVVYDDGEPVEVTHFSAERVPVSLGVALDTSGSMAGQKIREAETALGRFVDALLNRDDDEMFIYKFSNSPVLLQGWTRDRERLSRALDHITPNGGTAMYDAVAEAIPLASGGRNQKKALVVISDGNDTSSRAEIREIKRLIRESEVLVYAVGIDAEAETLRRAAPPPRVPFPVPLPFPPGRPRGRFPFHSATPQFGGQGGSAPWTRNRGDDRVNIAALRDMTDDSGGRTEIVRNARDLDPATAGIANELSQQYYLGYPSAAKRDGRWHSIRVELKGSSFRVRARRGYIAS